MPYKKQNFKDGEVLYASQLEKIEDGIIENFAELEKYYSLADLVHPKSTFITFLTFSGHVFWS